ncbi:MAG: hypothetical protein J6X42_01260 [Alphaproteobacteria bacterium]|nr:hypothetical protein [Alphaproteobacteria bacterium]
MKPKLLTKEQQLGIFNTPNAVELLREYISYGNDAVFVAQNRLQTDCLERFVRKQKKPVTELQKRFFENLSIKDADEIFFEIEGNVYPEVLIKMLETFSKRTSKELLLEYGKNCRIHDAVAIKAMEVFGKGAKDIIFGVKYLSIEVFNKMVRVFSKKGVKNLLIEWSDKKLYIYEDVEKKIVKIYSGEALKELIKSFIENKISIGGVTMVKIFDVCETRQEAKELIEQAIKKDRNLWNETLDKIVKYFPKKQARALLNVFFEETSPGRGYDAKIKARYYKALRNKKKK